jgi:hypothetical protein
MALMIRLVEDENRVVALISAIDPIIHACKLPGRAYPGGGTSGNVSFFSADILLRRYHDREITRLHKRAISDLLPHTKEIDGHVSELTCVFRYK